jgi:endonuclease/exonuclease/phosphatase family metal-dependent hydrolase
MPSFRRPRPDFNYHLADEQAAIDAWFSKRKVPKSRSGRLLLASWNIANLGEQKRDPKDLELIAHLMSRFDLIAVQEVKSNLDHLKQIVDHMGQGYDWLVNDVAGNNERLAFVFKKKKVKRGRLFGEIAIPEKDFPRHTVVVPYKVKKQQRVDVFYNLRFTPFDRNPFIGTFEAGALSVTLVNVHLYFGGFKDSKKVAQRAKYARRVLEIYMLGKWAASRAKRSTTYDRDIILLGDMNVPEMSADDAAYQALLKSGLNPLDAHSKAGGSNLDGSKTYDQLAITPGAVKERTLGYDVFDFDNAVFKDKWDELELKHGTKGANPKFNKYVKFHISDHRPLWMELDTAG